MHSFDAFRSLDFLGGQRAPRAADGVGVRVLYRCGSCQRVWLQDGKQVELELEEAQVQALAQELAADLTRLPTLTCRLCLFRAGGGAIEADEYGQGMGFGFSWEFPAPRPVHALLTMFSRRWLSRLRDPSALLPDVITRPQRMRAVLTWFAHCSLPARSWPLEPATVQELTRTNRPGRGQPGTANWRWHGRPVRRWRGRRCSYARSPCRPPIPSRCQRQLRCGKRWRASLCSARRRSQPCRASKRRRTSHRSISPDERRAKMSRLPLRPASDAVSAQTTPLARASSPEKMVVVQPSVFPAATEEAYRLW
ncbi:MAG TPA: hypothetical protein VFV38_39350 [Ktedonobacteraceae bacterium]|nr:hypothetical protein [Ktedonobacteraceae bacterium]